MENNNDQILEEENSLNNLDVKILDAQKIPIIKKFLTGFNFILLPIFIT